jgi:hypothetical protein
MCLRPIGRVLEPEFGRHLALQREVPPMRSDFASWHLATRQLIVASDTIGGRADIGPERRKRRISPIATAASA